MAATQAETNHPRVCILNISRGQIGIHLAGGLLECANRGAIVNVHLVESGPYLDAGRNRAVSEALKLQDPDAPNGLQWDWMLFVDSDMELKADNVFALFEPYHTSLDATPDLILDPLEHPVIGGYYMNPYDDGLYPDQGNLGPVVYEWGNFTNVLDFDPERIVPSYRRMSTRVIEEGEGYPHPSSPLMKVDVVGTGFMAIHSSILQPMLDTYRLPCPWFTEPIINERLYGEDLGFCFRLMEMDYPVLLHRGVRVTHDKTLRLNPPLVDTPTGDTPVPGV